MEWKYASDIAWQSVGGEVIIVDLRSGATVGLNPVGSFIWQRLPAADAGSLVAEIAAEWEISAEAARSDLETFLADLSTRGFLSPAH